MPNDKPCETFNLKYPPRLITGPSAVKNSVVRAVVELVSVENGDGRLASNVFAPLAPRGRVVQPKYSVVLVNVDTKLVFE